MRKGVIFGDRETLQALLDRLAVRGAEIVRRSATTGIGRKMNGCAILFMHTSPAGMAELADAADSKSADPCGHGGSTPPPGTMLNTHTISHLQNLQIARA